ncbi:hypothetical protein M0802_016290 [Mischocyttarus mexicanus]|nr:hypothetical protein M0802_016290 [Mischocyttarus mexicanus]
MEYSFTWSNMGFDNKFTPPFKKQEKLTKNCKFKRNYRTPRNKYR